MRTITLKDADELKNNYSGEKSCKPGEHSFAREIYSGSGTGDYVCLKCGFSFNECDRDKYLKGKE